MAARAGVSRFRIDLRLHHALRLSNALMDAYNTFIAGSLVAAKENEATMALRMNAFLTLTLQNEVVEEYNEYLMDL